MPIILFGVSLNILLAPAYIRFEYAMPHIPADPYGFSKSERFQWATQTIEYLTDIKQTRYLSRLVFENGSPVFSDYEIAFVDYLKNSLRKGLAFWKISLAASFILGMFAWSGNWAAKFVNGVRWGGWLSIGLAIVALVIAPIILKGFHPHLNFQNADTIMRLFPIRLWQDFILFMAMSMIESGFILILILIKANNILRDLKLDNHAV